MDLDSIWIDFFKILESQELTAVSINTWFKPMKPLKIENNKFYISVSNNFIRERLESSEYYIETIVDILKEITGNIYEIEFSVGDSEIEKVTKNSEELPMDNLIDKSRLLPKYTFDSFVVGKSNEFAHAASLAVAENPLEARANPLFIYGGVGLGKTHLMHAIGHFMLRQNPNKKVLYVTSEQFLNEFINATMQHKNEEFRKKYRQVDLLLIDDIQFIADKEGTQEEFFHTFNELHSANKQIVLTSDKPPNEIEKLEARLSSRFAMGLIVDIIKPDLETRIAILRKKSNLENFNVPEGVITYIAENVKSNIRELEGALSRVAAYGKLTTGVITEETAAIALKDIYESKQKKVINTNLIKEVISKNFNISVEDLNSKKRTRIIAYPRQIAMYLTRELTDLSLPKIGDEFGGRDHSTVIHAYEKILNDMNNDTTFKLKISELKKEIKGE